MIRCWFFVLMVQVSFHDIDGRPIKNSHQKDAAQAREFFTKLIRHTVTKVPLHLDPEFNDNDIKQEVGKGFSVNESLDGKNYTLKMTLPVSKKWLLKPKFLERLQSSFENKQAKCEITSVHTLVESHVAVELYCLHYSEETGAQTPLYITSHRMRRHLDNENMTSLLALHNSKSLVYKQAHYDKTTHLSKLLVFLKKHWIQLTLIGVGSTLLVVAIIIVVCCCRRQKNVEDGEKVEETSFEKTHTASIMRKDLKQSNVTPMSHNTYNVSPKKTLFSYSPNKMSTPIFSFTSPTKLKEKLVYPTSPIETSGPYPVQPQVELLYPSTLPLSSPSVRKLSGATSVSGNSSDKSNRTLLQSRRGSSASLVIDLSPRTPTLDLSLPLHESPTEEILMRKSRPLRFRELRRAQENDKELDEEFWSIPPNTVTRRDTEMKHSLKNRYPDILPNPRSIVRLQEDGSKERYINANYIKGYNGLPNQYIATQGPLANTICDFWQMIWQCKASAIVMITKLKEKNKEKCAQYWPSPDTITQQTYKNITVTYDSKLQRGGYLIHTLYATNKGSSEVRKITHYWFTSWPDHKVPKSCEQVVALAEDVTETHEMKGAPIVVHCSAGRGRTGCFIAISTGISQINEDKIVDILKIVSQMRIGRGGMVDKDHQYRFIYAALYEYWFKKLNSPTFSRTSIEEGDEENEDSCYSGSYPIRSFSFPD